MILLLRIVAVCLITYFLYILYEWWNENYGANIPCPQCDGEGTWESMREKEPCLLCKGKGKIERQ